MATDDSKPIPIQLDCGHKRWFKKPIPDVGEIIWCPECQKYADVGPGIARMGRTYYPEYDLEVEPIREGRNRWQAYCTHELDGVRCSHTAKGSNFYKLRDSMHSHYMRTHTRFAVKELAQQLEFNFEEMPGKKEAPF